MIDLPSHGPLPFYTLFLNYSSVSSLTFGLGLELFSYIPDFFSQNALPVQVLLPTITYICLISSLSLFYYFTQIKSYPEICIGPLREFAWHTHTSSKLQVGIIQHGLFPLFHALRRELLPSLFFR